MTGKLIITRGLPCSRKSTWAKDLVHENPEQVMRVNRDDLREMLHNGTYIKGSKDNPGTEQTVIQAELALVRRGLRAGLTVIDDNTNLPNRSVKQLVEIAEPLGAEWAVKDFRHLPLETVLEWNALRNQYRKRFDVYAEAGEVLDDSVIIDLYNRFIKGGIQDYVHTSKPELTVEKYLPDLSKPKAVIVDIDGTVARMQDRTPYEWEKVGSDTPILPIIRHVEMYESQGYQIIFLSGRKDLSRNITWMWLHKNVTNMDRGPVLFMRRADDNRPDDQMKLEIFNQEIRDNYNVHYALDDRDQVVALWRSLGITCLQVAEGNF